MKNEAILSDRLVISEETSAGEEAVRVRACVPTVWVMRVKQINDFPGGLLFEYVIFHCILSGGSGLWR